MNCVTVQCFDYIGGRQAKRLHASRVSGVGCGQQGGWLGGDLYSVQEECVHGDDSPLRTCQ